MRRLQKFLHCLNLFTLTNTLLCYQCSKAVYNETGNISYYKPQQMIELNYSCTATPIDCNGTEYEMCAIAMLVGDQKFPSEASYVEIYQCLEEGSDLCDSLGNDDPEACNYTTCSEDGCNSPPPISCPTCKLDFNEFCGAEESQECPSVDCSVQATECFNRFDADNCTLIRGCKEEDEEDSCEEDTCQTCQSDDCDVPAQELCTNNCTVYSSCYTCEFNLTDLLTEDAVFDKAILMNQCENSTCSKGVSHCKAELESCTVYLGCGANGNTTQCESESCEIFELASNVFDIIETFDNDCFTNQNVTNQPVTNQPVTNQTDYNSTVPEPSTGLIVMVTPHVLSISFLFNLL